MTPRPLTVAVIGAGPAGIATAGTLAQGGARVDLLERLPVPFGLVRYGVAPDRPLPGAIRDPLHAVLDRRDVRLLTGVDVGTDVDLDLLRTVYDAVVLATGAADDAPLPVPGVDLPGSFGASAFVSWYSAHPDAPTGWPLDAEHVAVVGAGNVALDVARMLSVQADDLAHTEVPDHVREALAASRVTDVHVLARRGPAEAAFSPQSLRALDEVPGVDVTVDPADLVVDRSSEQLMKTSASRRTILSTLQEWSGRAERGAPRRVHLHLMQVPVSIDGAHRVEGVTVERTRHLVNGTVEGTGLLTRYPVGQVYRAVGYAPAAVPGVPVGPGGRVVHQQGRVLDGLGAPVPGLYLSGWAKRGPVGLVGATTADAVRTAQTLLADLEDLPRHGDDDDPLGRLRLGAAQQVDGWDGWLRVDAHERALGAERGRARTKVHGRSSLTRVASGGV